MLHPYVRFALAALNLGFALNFFFFQHEPAFGLLMLGLGIFILYGHFYAGTVTLAAASLRKGKLDQAERQLRLTRNPKWLGRRYRAYFYYLRGLLEHRRKAFSEAYQDYAQALALGLPSAPETAALHYEMAETSFALGNPDEARRHIQAARQAYDGPELEDALRKLEWHMDQHPSA